MSRDLIRIGVIAIVWGALVFPGSGQTSAEACESQRSAWASSYEKLAQTAELCRNLRESSLQSRLEQLKASGEGGPSIARMVRAALLERQVALNQARRQCREAADRERFAFTDWRSCLSRSRVGGPQAGNAEIQAAVREREKLLKHVEDVLLDEAYVQYKNYRPPVAAEEEASRQQQRDTGYGQYGPTFGYR